MGTPEHSEPLARVRALSCWRTRAAIEPLGGGMTNLNFLARDGAERFVVRLGSDIPEHHIQRTHELAATRAAFAAGLGPEVVHAEPGVIVLRFIDGKALTAGDVRRPEMLPRVACLIRRCHGTVQRHFAGPALMFWPFHIVRDYAATLRAGASRWTGELTRLLETAAALERALGPVDIVYAHNDLLPANLIDDGARLWLIDWEYSGFGAASFDLANVASNSELDEAGETELLGCYYGRAPSAGEITAFNVMRAVSALRESMWGMVSALHSRLDVDFDAYARDYLSRHEQAMSRLKPLHASA